MSTILSWISGAPSHILLMLIFTYIKFQSMITVHYFDKSDLQSFKVPILQVVHTSFPNASLTSCPLFSPTFGWVQQQSNSKRTQKWVKKVDNCQSCIRKRSATCKIGTLASFLIFFKKSKALKKQNMSIYSYEIRFSKFFHPIVWTYALTVDSKVWNTKLLAF